MILFTLVGYVGMSRVRTTTGSMPFAAQMRVCRFQFVTGKIDALDRNVSKRSERSVQLEMAHKVAIMCSRASLTMRLLNLLSHRRPLWVSSTWNTISSLSHAQMIGNHLLCYQIGPRH